jgi:hypothetical protein
VDSIEAAPDPPLPRELALERARNIPEYKTIGRPTKLTDELADLLLAKIASGAFLNVACESVGIASKSLEEWTRRGAADNEAGLDTIFSRFWMRLHRARASHEIELARKVEEKTDEDWRAGAFVLERRYRERWGRDDKQNQGVNVTLVLGDKQQEILLELMKLGNAKQIETTASTENTNESTD